MAAARRHTRVLLTLLVGVGLCAATAGASSDASAPGTNGMIAGSVGTGIRLVNPNGTGGRQAFGTPSPPAFPAWSPDGTRLAYLIRDGDGNSLHVVDPFTGGDRRIMTRLRLGKVSWSPDGRRIAVVVQGESGGVHAVDVETGNPGPGLGAGVDPAWSPDGRWIAVGGGPEYLHLLDTQGGPSRLLFVRGSMPTSGPSWSPDGKSLAFMQDLPVLQGEPTAEIFVIPADGTGGKRKLATGRWPDWSPDGRHIVFSSPRGTAIVPAGGGTPRPINGGGAPSWQTCAPGAPCSLPPLCSVHPRARNVTFASEIPAQYAGRFRGRAVWIAIGTKLPDLICGSPKGDSLSGEGGGDSIFGGAGQDLVKGGPGNDFIDVRGGGIDLVYGGPGRDTGCFDKSDGRVSVEVRAC